MSALAQPGPGGEDGERQLRFLQTIISSTPDLVYAFDRNYRFIFANDALLQMWGKRPEEAIGRTLIENGYEPWHAEMHEREIDQVIATKRPIRGEVAFPHAVLGRRIYDYIFVPVLNENGEVETIAGTTRDVTDRKNAETGLRQSAAQFETLLNESPMGVYVVDGEMRLLAANPTARQALGDAPDLIGSSLGDVLPRSWPAAHVNDVMERFLRTLKTGAPYIVAESAERRLDRDEPEYYEWRISRIPLSDASYGVVCYFRDIAAQVEARRAIARSEERFRALVTASSDAVYSMSADWSEMRHMSGQGLGTDTETGDRKWLMNYIPEPDQAGMTKAMDAAIQNRTMLELEHRVLKSDGSIGWAYSRAVPLKDERGEIVEWFGAVKDITARKHQEEQRKLLLDELNHRVKNTLSTVQSIASQTSRASESIAGFKQAFDARLMALSRAHNLLTRGNWQGVGLFDVVRETLQPYEDAAASRLVLEGPDLVLKPNAAIMLNLVLHEMATNAAKYGALSVQNGRVAVIWAVRDAGEDSAAELWWRESGGPPVSPPSRAGFGSKLIDRGVREELEGEVDLDFASAGLQCRLRWPFRRNVSFGV